MKYSIITINYNNKDGLHRTIESVVNQTYKDYEYIIIDGGSTDGSVEIIKEYADKITYWVSETDKGIYNAMNKGIFHAHGEYLNFMNSGDCFYSTKVLESLDSLLVGDLVIGKDYRIINSVECEHGFSKKDISLIDLWNEPLNHQSAFIKRNLFCNRMYDESYKMLADQKFFLEVLILDNISFTNIDVPIVRYDMDGISAKQKEIYNSERKRLFEEVLPERICHDYVLFGLIDIPLLVKVSQLSRTRFLYKLAYCVISIFVIIKNLKKK